MRSSIVAHGRRSFVRAYGPFLRPDLHMQAHRAQRPSRLAVAPASPLAPALPGHALTGSSTARDLSWLGCRRICLDAFESASLVQNCPGNAGELVGESDREHVVVEALLSRLDPGLEPVAFPALRFDEDEPGGLHKQDTQIAITALGYLAQDRAVPG